MRTIFGPQSNQRGIETSNVGIQIFKNYMGLNRTSVGLKQSRLGGSGRSADRPQSNQRGIETKPKGKEENLDLKPQSNQRGIETSNGVISKSHQEVPQSNQRGIETTPHSSTLPFPLCGLNRTSVGLKHNLPRLHQTLT